MIRPSRSKPTAQVAAGTMRSNQVPPPTQKDPDLFEAFWKAYPKRPNNPRHKAKQLWEQAIKHTPADVIMAALARYDFSPEPKYRPMASTWLYQRRYECTDDDLNIDAYGLEEWLGALPRDGTLSALAYDVEELRAVMVATGLPSDWRGSLDALNGWMRDGYSPYSCARVIAATVAEFGTRQSLMAFDGRVRHRAERSTGK
jgi:hypothetical protein